ncbi:MAG: Na+/H+ antiporter NhaA [Actinomycetota bacterium]
MADPRITEEDAELRLPWARSDRRLARRFVQPLQAFFSTEIAGALFLLIAAVAALAWANSPWAATYEHFWSTQVASSLGDLDLSMDLHAVVNEGLMTLFFFVVGLEIKREMITGELRNPRSVALPVVAAIGGMLVPAVLYIVIVGGGPGARGWGIPMATDIAFAVAVLTLAGRGLPSGLRSFLLTLAIADDIGAIVVIAIVYSAGVQVVPLLIAAGLLGVMGLLNRVHVRFMTVYVVLGIGVWFAVFASGVHATIAGVVLGLLVPARPFQRPKAVSEAAKRVADRTGDHPDPPDADSQDWLQLADLSREAVSPLARLESKLHPWTSLVIVPLFALANAGVTLTGGRLGEASTGVVVLAIIAGLVIGKTVGITGATWLGLRLGLSGLPRGASLSHVVGVAAVAGIGFTVALFVAGLAFDDPALTAAAKVGILVASVLAGVLGTVLLRVVARRRAVPVLGDDG